MICALRLPFRAIEHIELKKWVRMASFASSPPKIMSADEVTDLLKKQVNASRDTLLSRLCQGSKISIAADCWQSPNKYSFLAVVG
jgi:hypothetical protein